MGTRVAGADSILIDMRVSIMCLQHWTRICLFEYCWALPKDRWARKASRHLIRRIVAGAHCRLNSL